MTATLVLTATVFVPGAANAAPNCGAMVTTNDSNGNLVRSNTVRNNADGIHIAYPGTRCAATSPPLNGVAGNTDGGGNRSSGNDEAAQCFGVVCTA